MRSPTCHPDRPHQAKGLCSLCYWKQYDEARREKRSRRKDPSEYAANYRVLPVREPRVPSCHPERKHCAVGLCRACYQRARRAAGPGNATCHPERTALARGLCHACYSSDRYWSDPEHYRAVAREKQAATRRRLRDAFVEAYGGRCSCTSCPETNPAFLTLDHVDGGGRKHRRELGSHVYADLRRRGWPQEGFRILCWNCNAGRQFNGGVCPHEVPPP